MKKIKLNFKVSLKKRFYLLMFIVFINMFIIAIFSLYSNYQSSKSLTSLSNLYFPAIQNSILADMIHDGLRANVNLALFQMLNGSTSEDKVEIEKENMEMTTKFISYIENIQKMNLDENIQTNIERLLPILKEYSNTSTRVINAAFSLNGKKALEESNKFNILFKKLEVELDLLSESIEKLSNGKIEGAKNSANNFQLLNLIIILFFMLLSGFISFIFIKKITNVTFQIIESLNLQSQEIRMSASNINDTSHELYNAAKSQSDSLQKTSTAIHEINSMVKRTSESTFNSSVLSKRSEETVLNGKKSVNELISCIEKVKVNNVNIMEKVTSSNKRFTEIIKVISNISSRTKVINEIVFKTKLLSFNASVEAARAGEHGRGFSVVAEEVGSLAMMSGEAAKEINKMLAESIAKVEDIISVTNSEVSKIIALGDESINESTELANNCTNVMENTVENVSLVNKSITDISLAAKEQEAGISEIVKAITEIEILTQANESIANHSSQASRDLTEKANIILEIIHNLNYIMNGEQVEKL
ncbi:HAMP domain-containing methyl-accepting chemotaxis protein [Fluviispira vulneris]|uniref:HAMP domain-containing methyl-accepting chemotaxis protein n=1 Tax=Fluviispira vulneris TaxID=2763012 RepID=UPI0016447F8B|nr:methyl-accepting chemotaxis protein [Fluviispira vulneris]